MQLNHLLSSSVVLEHMRTGNPFWDMVCAALVSTFLMQLFQLDLWGKWTAFWRTDTRDTLETRIMWKPNSNDHRERDGSQRAYEVLTEYIYHRMEDVKKQKKQMFLQHKTNPDAWVETRDTTKCAVRFLPLGQFILDGMQFELVTAESQSKKKSGKTNDEQEEADGLSTTKEQKILVIKHETEQQWVDFQNKALAYVAQMFDQQKDERTMFQYCHIGHRCLEYHIYRSQLPERKFSNLIMPADTLRRLKQKAHDFKTCTGYYHPSKNNPYSLTILMSSVPGNGKTMTIQTLIQYFGVKRVTVIPSIAVFRHDKDLREILFSENKDLEMIVFEEIDAGDTGKVLQDRKTKRKQQSAPKTKTSSVSTASPSPLSTTFTLMSWLDAFNGLMVLHNRIILMTTNHLEYLDPAIYRKRRVNEIIQLTSVTEDTLKQFMKNKYPKFQQHQAKTWTTLLNLLKAHQISHAVLQDVHLSLKAQASGQNFVDQFLEEIHAELKTKQRLTDKLSVSQ